MLALASILSGALIGAWRVGEIEAAGFEGRPGSRISVSGALLEAPRRTSEGWKASIETGEGRLLVEASGSRPSSPGPGDWIEVKGVLRKPSPWLVSGLKSEGIDLSVAAREVRFGGAGRMGIEGVVDLIRSRAETALGYGIPAEQAALARGFVLGQDQSIGDDVIDRFRDSGLAHLLAVSGQNVMLLLLLAWVVFSLAGLPLRLRYPVLIGLVLLYVPLAGSGPSIQRAGVMGLAGLAAALAGRPLERVFPVALAAAATLVLDPFAAGDVGWQLSFAAVVGILALAKPMANRFSEVLGGTSDGVRTALSTGAAVTVAASLATLPLIGFHFGRLPVATVAANLLALPAVAPSMWLGMLSATVGQAAPWLALPLNLVNAVLLAFIGGIAEWLGGPDSVVEVGGNWWILLLLATFSVVAGLLMVKRPGIGLALVAISVVLPVADGLSVLRGELPDPPPGGISVDVLDVGQGDAILIRTQDHAPLLVDTGPPDGDVAGLLDAFGIERLGGLVLTHLDRDHIGGFDQVFEGLSVGTVMAERMTRQMRERSGFIGASVQGLGLGDRFRLGPAEVEVLWPPPQAGPDGSADRNARSLVLLVETAGRTVLLTGDAESELVQLDPGPVDILKVAHHGSEDTGLGDLLARTGPGLALISAGKGNSYGHPVDSTLAALESNGSKTYRTDLDGTISVLVGRSGEIEVETTD